MSPETEPETEPLRWPETFGHPKSTELKSGRFFSRCFPDKNAKKDEPFQVGFVVKWSKTDWHFQVIRNSRCGLDDFGIRRLKIKKDTQPRLTISRNGFSDLGNCSDSKVVDPMFFRKLSSCLGRKPGSYQNSFMSSLSIAASWCQG